MRDTRKLGGIFASVRALDSYDRALLARLQEDALLTSEQLAQEIALSPSAIARRVRRLRTEGIILANRAVVSHEVGPFLTALVDVQLARHRRSEFDALLQRLMERPEVQAILDVTGTMDFMLIVAVRDLDAFNDFADEVLAEDPAVQRYQTRVIKKRRKFTTAWPMG